MKKNITVWKKGPGKLGALKPLIGTWEAFSDSPMGEIKCTRTFTPILAGKFVHLSAIWEFSKNKYEELAIYGVENGKLIFKSYTSDGKSSSGVMVSADEIHKQAIAFEAQMPAGLARFVYWPVEDGKIKWVVESKNKKGWNRFVEHNYSPVTAALKNKKKQ